MDSSRVDWIIENRSRYYEVLGIEKDADLSAIRRSYHKLTLQLHPDKTQGDRKAEEACCAVIRAYEVLKDSTLRRVYDERGSDGVQKYEEMSDFSVRLIITSLLRVVLHLLLRHVSRRMMFEEELPDEFAPPGDANPRVCQAAFARLHRPQRRTGRRRVGSFFAVVVLGIILCALGVRFGRHSTSATPCAASPFTRMTQRVAHEEAGTTFIFHVEEKGPTWAIWRPLTVNETEAREAAQRWVNAFCPRERLFAWAARERYEPTASLRVQRLRRVVPSPNRAAKRKWPRREWQSKYTESFTIRSAKQLFVPSPLCAVMV